MEAYLSWPGTGGRVERTLQKAEGADAELSGAKRDGDRCAGPGRIAGRRLVAGDRGLRVRPSGSTRLGPGRLRAGDVRWTPTPANDRTWAAAEIAAR